MDDRNFNINNEKNLHKQVKKHKFSLLRNFLSSTTTTNNIKKPSPSSSSLSSNTTCLSILKQFFHQSSKSDCRKNILTY